MLKFEQYIEINSSIIAFIVFICKIYHLYNPKLTNLEKIYNSIKEDIKNHPDVQTSLLGMVEDWKRSQFVILADLISKNLSNSLLLTDERRISLGTSLSPITLQRFYENDYQIKTHNDLRFIKTLDKLCIFLGKKDLNEYIYENLQGKNILNKKEDPSNQFSEKELIVEFCRLQFETLKHLPAINLGEIATTVWKDSPLLERITLYFKEKAKNNLVFVTDRNRSNYEIFQITEISDDDDLKVFKTQEFWNLIFKDENGTDFILHHLNTQFYFMKKLNGEWKIWDNYNPDHGKILKIN